MSVPTPRLQYANRQQCQMRADSLDQLLPPDHVVRDIWEFVQGLDLSPLLQQIRAVPGGAGAPAIDPRILMALWLYATIEGIGSSRALDELCQNHLAYRWLCGEVGVNYHTLSDFRTGHGELLNQLLTQTVAALLHGGVVELKRVAQDGMRVRAAAGASSFRRPATIQRCLNEARAQVEALRGQDAEEVQAVSRRQAAAQARAAVERTQRLEKAQREFAQLEVKNARRAADRRVDPSELRVSTTDPAARKMKMPDGGFRPAYNVQFASTTEGGVIVGVDVDSEGTDAEQMPPMLEQLERRYEQRPAEMLVDGGFASLDAIDTAETKGTTIYAPVKEKANREQAGRDPFARTKADTDATAQWRARMATPDAQTIYRERASTAEWVNAQARNRGLYRVAVRGRTKVLTVVLWYVLAHNFQRLQALRSTA